MRIPLIDDRIQHVGVSHLRGLNATSLRKLKDVLVIQVDEKPVAVVIPYAMYLQMQKIMWPSTVMPSLDKAPVVEIEPVRSETPPVPPGISDMVVRYDGRPLEDIIQSELDETGQEAFEAEYKQSPAPGDPPSTWTEQHCAHCGGVSDKLLCLTCFMEGHRDTETGCITCGAWKP